MDYIKLCARCGIEFKSDAPDRICKDCKEQKRKEERFRTINAKLLNDVSNADKLGISYGEYKAGEEVWTKRTRKFRI